MAKKPTKKAATKRNPMQASRPVEPHAGLCGAKARHGGLCRQPAGFRTDHIGDGRCYLHGGATPTKHGRYSSIKRAEIRELIEKHEADPDPLDILPELAAARALFQDYVDRYNEWRDALIAWHESFTTGTSAPKPHQVLDVADAYRIVSEITKIVERIEKTRAANAITYEQLKRFLFGVERILETRIRDDSLISKIRDDLLALRP